MDVPQSSRSLIKTAQNKAAWKKLAKAISNSSTTTGPVHNGEQPPLPTPRREDHHHHPTHFPNATAASACHQLLSEPCRRVPAIKRTHPMRTRSRRTTTTTTTTMNPTSTAKPPTLSASAPSFVPPLKLKQAKIKKTKPKMKKMTYEAKVTEYNQYLWEHHGKYRAAVNAVFDSGSSEDYSGNCSYFGEDSFHSVMHSKGDKLCDFVPTKHNNPTNSIQFNPRAIAFQPTTPQPQPQPQPASARHTQQPTMPQKPNRMPPKYPRPTLPPPTVTAVRSAPQTTPTANTAPPQTPSKQPTPTLTPPPSLGEAHSCYVPSYILTPPPNIQGHYNPYQQRQQHTPTFYTSASPINKIHINMDNTFQLRHYSQLNLDLTQYHPNLLNDTYD